VINLIRAEWLKLTRRPLTQVLLGVFLVLLLLQQFSQALFAGMVQLGEGSGLAAQVEEYRRRSTFPGVIGMALGHLNSFGAFFAIILAAGAMGGEYGWGTLRTQLARWPNRAQFLLAKAITLMLLLLVAALITIGLACLVALLTSRVVGVPGALSGGDLIALPASLLRALLVLLPYTTMALCYTIMGRSQLVGVACGLVYLVLEGGFGALTLFAELGGIWQDVYNLTIGQNINTLVIENSRTFGLHPDQIAPAAARLFPPFWQALIVITIYTASFLGVALFLFRRRDIGGAG
jgi:ABC-2 type transport system permease protein